MIKKTGFIVWILVFFISLFSEGTLAQTENYCKDPNSHPEGDKCYCNEGYINHNGKCRDPYAVCRGYNATYSPAIKNCKCADGYEEKNNYCVKIEEKNIELDVNSDNNEKSSEKSISSENIINTKAKDDDSQKDNVSKNKSIAEDKVVSLMNKYYSEHDEETQEIIKENSEKIKKLEKDSIEPSSDIYGNINDDSEGKSIIEALKIPIKESFNILSKDEREEAKEQFETISDFSEPSFLNDEEITLEKDKKDILEQVKEDVIEKSLVKKKNDWRKDLEKAEKENKLKEGVSKDDFELEKEMEERLKWQIANIKKSIGFEHMRIIEVTGIVKPDKMPQPVAFERMSGEYRDYFGNKSAVSNEGGELAGVVFEKSVKNITGMNKQLEDLKKALKSQYPDNWKKKYLDVSEEPTKEEQEKEIEKVGLFNFIQNNSKK